MPNQVDNWFKFFLVGSDLLAVPANGYFTMSHQPTDRGDRPLEEGGERRPSVFCQENALGLPREVWATIYGMLDSEAKFNLPLTAKFFQQFAGYSSFSLSELSETQADLATVQDLITKIERASNHDELVNSLQLVYFFCCGISCFVGFLATFIVLRYTGLEQEEALVNEIKDACGSSYPKLSSYNTSMVYNECVEDLDRVNQSLADCYQTCSELISVYKNSQLMTVLIFMMMIITSACIAAIFASLKSVNRCVFKSQYKFLTLNDLPDHYRGSFVLLCRKYDLDIVVRNFNHYRLLENLHKLEQIIRQKIDEELQNQADQDNPVAADGSVTTSTTHALLRNSAIYSSSTTTSMSADSPDNHQQQNRDLSR